MEKQMRGGGEKSQKTDVVEPAPSRQSPVVCVGNPGREVESWGPEWNGYAHVIHVFRLSTLYFTCQKCKSPSTTATSDSQLWHSPSCPLFRAHPPTLHIVRLMSFERKNKTIHRSHIRLHFVCCATETSKGLVDFVSPPPLLSFLFCAFKGENKKQKEQCVTIHFC